MSNYIFPEKVVVGGVVYVCVAELCYGSKRSYNNLVRYVHTDAYPLTKFMRKHDKGEGYCGIVAVYVMERFEDQYYDTLIDRLLKSNNADVETI